MIKEKDANIDEPPETDLLKRAIQKAKLFRDKQKTEETKATSSKIRQFSKSPERVLRGSKENLDQNLVSASIQELRVKNMKNFRDLENLTTHLKTSLLSNRDDLESSQNMDDLARATDQNLGGGFE